MRQRACAAAIAALMLGSGAAAAACPTGKTRNCVNFDLVPQISQDIVASEPTRAPPKKPPEGEAKRNYTGPTIGTVPNVHRAPEVGYRWAIN